MNMRHRIRFALLLAAAGLTACASAGMQAAGPPDAELETRLSTATTPTHRLEVVFDWNVQDRDARLNGRGVLRLDRADRARVDLFGVRGETLAAAIVEDGQMRVVPTIAASLLPPPALLWSVLGSFRPPEGVPLTGSRASGDDAVLEYARDGNRWLFRFQNDALRSMEWTAASGRRTVTLAGSADYGLPQQASFRDWAEFRELNLNVTRIQETTGFDADTWILPGERPGR